jgi:ketosteroid isomerase-like protein
MPVAAIFADADMVIILFDATATAKDGIPYRNTDTWYFQMKKEGKVIKAIAFSTRETLTNCRPECRR